MSHEETFKMSNPQPITPSESEADLSAREERLSNTILAGRLIRTVVNTWAFLGFWVIAAEYTLTSYSNGNAEPVVGYLSGLLLGITLGLWSWIRHDADAINKEL